MNPQMTAVQQRLDLIPHDYRGEIISQRSKDGYINATAMCKAAGKQWSEYRRRHATTEFLEAVALGLGIPQSQLIITMLGTPGGEAINQGTWVHPHVAINLAQWVSPRFAALVSQWVYDWMSRAGLADRAWKVFNDRLDLINDQVPVGFFCIFRETADVYASLIRGGINPGLRIILDISVGQHWSRHWISESLEASYGPRARYTHNFPSYWAQSMSNPQNPYCYPEDSLPAFRRWMREVYIPMKLPVYLKDQVRQKKVGSTEASAAVEALEQRDRRRSLPSAA